MKILLLLLFIFGNLFSAPAYNAKRIFTQANGEEFQARSKGNHHLNWIEDENGEILKYNAQTKNYEYAVIEDIHLKASGEKYQKQNLIQSQSRSLRRTPRIDKKSLNALYLKRKSLRTTTHTH